MITKMIAVLMIGAILMLRVSAAVADQPTDPIECLAKNVYYEAAGESFDGRVAVAAVTVNRADSDASKVCDTVYFKAINPTTHKKEAAFSWTLGAKWRAKGPINIKAMEECILIARAVLAGELHSRFDSNVKHYHTAAVNPQWKLEFVAQVGHHLFYKD